MLAFHYSIITIGNKCSGISRPMTLLPRELPDNFLSPYCYCRYVGNSFIISPLKIMAIIRTASGTYYLVGFKIDYCIFYLMHLKIDFRLSANSTEYSLQISNKLHPEGRTSCTSMAVTV